MALQKPKKPVEAELVQGYSSAEDEIATSFPTIAEFLSLNKWEDGSKRLPGVVMLLQDNGWCKAWVHDKDASRAAWVSSTTFWGLLEQVEAGLKADTLEWRPDRQKGSRKS